MTFSSLDVVAKGTIANAQNGVFKFTELEIISTPGKTVVGTLNLFDFETFGSDIGFLTNPI